jgi:hypothetical protein
LAIRLTDKSLTLLLGATDTAAETLGKAIDTATGINNFLLASVERVAAATYVYVQCLTQSRASSEAIAAAASYCNVNVIWMNVCFHDECLCELCRHPISCRAPHMVKKNGCFQGGAILPETRLGATQNSRLAQKTSSNNQTWLTAGEATKPYTNQQPSLPYRGKCCNPPTLPPNHPWLGHSLRN